MRKLYLDIETNGLNGSTGDLLLVGYAIDGAEIAVLGPSELLDPEYGHPLVDALMDPDVATVCHSPFDVRFLLEAGYVIDGPMFDTKVMAWVLNENTPLDLDWLAWRYAGVDMDKRLKRSGGRIFFEYHDGARYALDEWEDWYGTDVWREFEDYNFRDVAALRELELELEIRLDEAEWTDYWMQEEVPYTRVLVDMALRGLPIDLDAVAHLTPIMEEEAARLESELLSEAGLPESFNLNSPVQLNAYLFSRLCTLNDVLLYDKETVECLKSCLDGEHEDCSDNPEAWELGLHAVQWLPEGFTLDKLGRDRVHGHWTVPGRKLAPTPKTINKVTGEEGKLPSTSSPELLYKHAADPWVKKLCTEYRKAEKLLTTYLRKFPVIARDGRIYGQYNQTGTVTGRLSSFDPNMQNMPARGEKGKMVRSLFTYPPESNLYLVIADYDQLEMRIMASMSGDPRLTRVFRNGEDPHLLTAQGIFGMGIDPHGEERDIGKTLNYAMGYGAGAKKIAQTLSLMGFPTDPMTAKGYLAEMARFYRGLFEWKEWVIEDAKRKNSVRTLGGRRRRLKGQFKDTANWKQVGYGERQAVNAIVQGTAADIIRRAMVRIDGELDGLTLLAQVHDELLLESMGEPKPDTLHQLQFLGEESHGFGLAVPLVFEPSVGRSWAEKGGKDAYDFLAEDVADE